MCLVFCVSYVGAETDFFSWVRSLVTCKREDVARQMHPSKIKHLVTCKREDVARQMHPSKTKHL